MMAFDSDGNYIPDGGPNSSPGTTDPNQGFGVPNSFGLSSQPQFQTMATAPQYQYQGGPMTMQSNTPFQDSLDKAGYQSPSDIDQAKYLAAQNQGPANTGPGTPIPGGSRSVSYGGGNIANQQPYLGGPQGTVAAAGYQPPGAMPTTLMDQYKAFLTDPSGGLNSPVFQAILGQGQTGAERGALAGGGNGSPNVATALQKQGIAAAGQYLPSMAGMLQQGAATEGQRYGQQTAAQQGAGNLGLGEYNAGATSQLATGQANYGIGQDQYAQQQAQQAQQPINQMMTMMMQRQMQGY